MRIRELRAKAREDAQGNKWAIVLPLFITTVAIYLIGLIPDLFKDGIGKAIIGLLVFAGVLFISIAGSYAVMIRTLHVARKEEKTDFFSDVFDEGMRHGFSCAWGIFKKIWDWFFVFVLGYLSLVVGIISNMGAEFLKFDAEEAIQSSYSVDSVFLMVIGIILVTFTAIRIMIISYKYFLVTYLKHDYPDKSTNELLEKSKEMMDGNKAKAFVIPLTFFGWLILAAICGAVVSVIFNIIWPPYSFFGYTIPTMPIWAEILMTIIIYFITSFVTAYMQLTYTEFYFERNPLEIYNEDYVKPETNAPKYKKIIGWLCGIIAVVYIAIIALGGFVFRGAGDLIDEYEGVIDQFMEENNISE